MDVILREDYPSLGYVGDRIKVRDGYARNFLIPRGIALEASSRNARLLNHKLAGIEARKAKLKAEAEAVAKTMEGLALAFVLKAGEGGKVFGSINIKDIGAAIAEKGFTVDRKQIRLLEPIRKAGEFKISIKLHSQVTITVPVTVTSEVRKAAAVESAAPGAGAEKAPKKKGKRSKKEGAQEGEGSSEAPAPAEKTE